MNRIAFNHTSIQGIDGRRNNDRVLTSGFNGGFSLGVFVIADGMGIHADGGIASDIFCEEVRGWWKGILSELQVRNKINFKKGIEKLEKTLQRINRKVIEFSSNKRKNVGTRGAVLFIYKNRYIIKHVGDCRVYLLKDKIERITAEHSWAAELYERGGINQEEYINHRYRKNISNYFGNKDGIEINSIKGKVQGESVFIMCTDGFYTEIEDRELEELKSEDEEYKKTVKTFLKSVKDMNGEDDKTVLVIKIES